METEVQSKSQGFKMPSIKSVTIDSPVMFMRQVCDPAAAVSDQTHSSARLKHIRLNTCTVK